MYIRNYIVISYLLRLAITSAGTPLKTDDPATIIFAPAFAASSIVSRPRPPSTSIFISGHLSLKANTYANNRYKISTYIEVMDKTSANLPWASCCA